MSALIQMHTPAITGCSARETSHAWRRELGFVTYYTLDYGDKRIAPFGKIGPFPTPSEMRAAMDRLEAGLAPIKPDTGTPLS